MRYAGIVHKGKGSGRKLGFPTLNIPLAGEPLSGIYAARVKVGEEWYEAAAYADPARGILEAHVLDFSHDLYGWQIEIEILEKLRESRRFADDTALARAIRGDIARVRAYFAG